MELARKSGYVVLKSIECINTMLQGDMLKQLLAQSTFTVASMCVCVRA